MKNLLIFVLCFQIVFVFARIRNNIPNPYPQLDRPLVEPLCPQGFRVSVPNINGMQLLGFHGNINSAIGNREGNYSGDVRVPSGNGRWEYTNFESQLRNGDIINYWIVAQVGQENYRVENLRHVVKDYSPCEPLNKYRVPSGQYSTARPQYSTPVYSSQAPAQTICENNTADLALILNQLNTTLMQLNSLNVVVNPLRQQVESLTELLQELIKDKDIGTKLQLVGEVPRTNPVETIRDLLTDRLQLYDLDTKILQAEYTNNGISFEMSSPIDKKRILFRASKLLKKSNYKIVDPESYNYENDDEEKKSGRNQRTILHRVD